MPRQISLGTLRGRLRQRTDKENETDRFPDAELNGYLNSGVDMFRQEMLILGGQGLTEADTTFLTVQGQQFYALPADWVQVLKVWQIVDGNRERVYRTYQEIETDGMKLLGISSDEIPWFRVIGDNISLQPAPSSSGLTVHVRYAQVATTLNTDLNTTDGLGGFEEYIICYAGGLVATKDGDDGMLARLDAKRGEVLRRLRAVQKKRNAQSARITDVEGPSLANQKAGRWRARFP